MKKYYDENLSCEERAEALVDEMTVEESASRLRYDSPAIERLGIPSYNWWNEALHGLARSGVATVFPQAIGLAATFDVSLIEKIGDAVSTEARAKYNAYKVCGDNDIYKGLTFWSPNINIFRDPRWGRGQETYGEDPYLTAECGKAYVKGLQGTGKVLKSAACAKHMAVHSGPESLRHEFNAVVSEKDLEETYLPAFKALVSEAKVEGVMGAYNRVNGEVSCANKYFEKKLKEWGFDGYFVSDCYAINDFHEGHGITKTPAESASLALKSGCDINCGPSYRHIPEALDKGLIDENDVRKACIHAMRTLIRLGFFDQKTEYDDIDYTRIACDEHKNLSLEAARRSVVLLKNNGILPLKADMSTIAVIGPNASSIKVLEGNYNGISDRYTTILQGIQDRFGGRVLYSEGCHLYKDRVVPMAQKNDRISEAISVAEKSDIVILCLGFDISLEGEEGETDRNFSSGDRNDLRLPESQRILLYEIKKRGKPLVVICTGGGSVNIETEVDALLHAWYPGSEGGTAVAEILFGDISPSAKLPVTFYEKVDALPSFTDYSMSNRTYRYAKNNILYPFGYGLGYSEIICSDACFSDMTLSFSAENKGLYECEDVVQCYVKDYCNEAVPNYSLCGFKRIMLAPGETGRFDINLNPLCFTSVDKNGVRCRRSGRFTIYCGTHQPDKLSCELSGTGCLTLEVFV